MPDSVALTAYQTVAVAGLVIVAESEGQAERIYLAEAAGAEPRPELGWDELRAEWMTDVRWWTREEIDAYDGVFSPRRFKDLLRELDEHGPPAEPVDVGV